MISHYILLSFLIVFVNFSFFQLFLTPGSLSPSRVFKLYVHILVGCRDSNLRCCDRSQVCYQWATHIPMSYTHWLHWCIYFFILFDLFFQWLRAASGGRALRRAPLPVWPCWSSTFQQVTSTMIGQSKHWALRCDSDCNNLGKRWVKVRVIRDSAKSSWGSSGTALSQAKGNPDAMMWSALVSFHWLVLYFVQATSL